jgi:Cyclin, N-terminal domain/Cyclin, C-terminal domain
MDNAMYSVDDAACYMESMLEQEKNAYRGTSCKYLQGLGYQIKSNNANTQDSIDEDCRSKMVDWCYKVVDFCKYSRETVSITMSYVDRFLATPRGLLLCSNIRTFQLACMTCLYTAVKIHEPEAMQPDSIAKLSQGVYSAEEVEAMELEIIKALEWRLNPPTALSFLRVYLSFLPKEFVQTDDITILFDLANYQIELSTGDSSIVGVSASSVALAALFNVFRINEDDTIPLLFLQEISSKLEFQYDPNLVHETEEKLWKALHSDHKGKLCHRALRNASPPIAKERNIASDKSPCCVVSR